MRWQSGLEGGCLRRYFELCCVDCTSRSRLHSLCDVYPLFSEEVRRGSAAAGKSGLYMPFFFLSPI